MQKPAIIEEVKPFVPTPIDTPKELVRQEEPPKVKTTEELISDVFGSEKTLACAIMLAESGGNQYAVGDRNNPPVSVGLFQIRTLKGRPSKEALFNPQTNIEYAKKLRTSGGFGHWSVYTNGKYKKYMGRCA